MNLLILTSSHPYKNAGIVAKDIFDSLEQSKNINVRILCQQYDEYGTKSILPIDNFFVFHLKKTFKKVKKNIFNIVNKGIIDDDYSVLELDQTKSYYSHRTILKKARFKPDAILVLFMQRFLSFKTIYKLYNQTKAPIFLYLMDMGPLTGLCHYAWNCRNYQKVCGKCPAIFSNSEIDQAYNNFIYKKRYILQSKIVTIAASEWTFQQLVKSTLFGSSKHYKILLPTNENFFMPSSKTEAQGLLNLPNNKKIIFFGAYLLSNRRKGFVEVIKALNILHKLSNNNDEIHLAIAGHLGDIEIDNIPFNFTKLGHLSHVGLLHAFQSSHIFISPSIEDSGPMMVNQSLMCGTPIVAFEMGVAMDLVITGKTGYMAKLNDCNDFARGILEILNLKDDYYTIMSQNCRNLAIKVTSLNSFKNNFIEILTENCNRA